MKFALLLLTLVCLAAAGVVWVLPVEYFELRAAANAIGDPGEAAGQAVALVWLARVAAPLLAVASVAAVWHHAAFSHWTRQVIAQAADVTMCRPATATNGSRASARSWSVRLLILGWFGLACWHGGIAIADRTRDWPVYKLNSGDAVLPNISPENRLVIRYLTAATPDDARIVVFSDQKLFFLSYYLLPRQLYHRMHPDAEFVIPRAHGELPLRAFRRDEITDDELAALEPDYVLEYFEGPEYVDRKRLDDDRDWITFWRRSTQSPGLPEFTVVLTPFVADAAP
jgi:hypothetical protein